MVNIYHKKREHISLSYLPGITIIAKEIAGNHYAILVHQLFKVKLTLCVDSPWRLIFSWNNIKQYLGISLLSKGQFS